MSRPSVINASASYSGGLGLPVMPGHFLSTTLVVKVEQSARCVCARGCVGPMCVDQFYNLYSVRLKNVRMKNVQRLLLQQDIGLC